MRILTRVKRYVYRGGGLVWVRFGFGFGFGFGGDNNPLIPFCMVIL